MEITEYCKNSYYHRRNHPDFTAAGADGKRMILEPKSGEIHCWRTKCKTKLMMKVNGKSGQKSECKSGSVDKGAGTHGAWVWQTHYV